jgi:hypothetical protein
VHIPFPAPTIPQFCGNLDVPYSAIKCGACCSELPPLKAAELEQLEGDEGAEQVGGMAAGRGALRGLAWQHALKEEALACPPHLLQVKASGEQRI